MCHSENLLRGSALAFINFKGGSMKTTLAASMATIASETEGWNTVVVDLDSSAPLTNSIFYQNHYEEQSNVLEALRRLDYEEPIDDLLLPAPQLGQRVFVLPGDGRGAIPEANYGDLIQAVKQCFVEGEPVDLIIVDCPGENEVVNANVLMGVDFVAMPASFTATDITASKRTIGLIRTIQEIREDAPLFLGFIPAYISKGAAIDRAVVTSGEENLVIQMINSGMLLPFIPTSEHLRKTFVQISADGLVTVPGFARNTYVGQRIFALWDAINRTDPQREQYLKELLEYLSLSSEDLKTTQRGYCE